jgi:tRNA-uridine 2-sulfurtransferase
MPDRVVLAMSGGVDSSVAAMLLKRQGYEVIGLFMRTGVHSEPGVSATGFVSSIADASGSDRKKGCCSALDAGDARRVADRLDIPFYALDFEQDFNRIIDYFADEYLAGRTPNPCVVCNTWLKFGKLWSFGKQLDADFIATGHYARMIDGLSGPELHRAVDPDKDQSYVLFGIRRAILPHLLFPLGDYRKDEIRGLARESGLAVADKPDSVEICFVPDQDHAGLVRRRRPGRETSGVIRDTAGVILGEHDGYERFTIGQRKGLGVAAASRRYVLEIVPDTREVIVGDPEELRAGRLTASRVNWLIELPAGPIDCQVKIRYRHTPAAARLITTNGGGAQITFAELQSAITPGQAVVFYDGDRVLGGGWIESAL